VKWIFLISSLVIRLITDSVQQCLVVCLQLNADESSPACTRPAEEFAVPDSLVHHFVIVPSKLRLVTLAAFLLWKCTVSLDRYEGKGCSLRTLLSVDLKLNLTILLIICCVLYFVVCVHFCLLICYRMRCMFAVAVFAFLLLNSFSSTGTINTYHFVTVVHNNMSIFNDNSFIY